ncbi:MAG: asparagine synthase-related protein, partial [Gaiella sp.]
DAQLALPDDMLHYFDRTSMAHSLEVRVPFLDHHLVEWAATIPSNLKIHRTTAKHILKHAARGHVPDYTIDKRKIGFFRQASSDWITSQLPLAIDRYLGDDQARVAAFLNTGVVRTIAREQTSRHTQLLLGILMLEIWLRQLESGVTPAADR